MRQKQTGYELEVELLNSYRLQVKRALQRMAFDIRSGTADEQILYNAIFGNFTKFGVDEAVLLSYHFSFGENALATLKDKATDANIQVCVNGIKANLIAIQKDASRAVVGLAV